LVSGGGKWQKLILAGLAVLLAATLLNTLYFKGGGEEAGNGKGAKVFNLGTLPPANMPVVNLELLENLNVPVKVTRNIFDPVYRPPVIKPVITPVPATPPPGAGRPNPNYVRPPTPPTREELEAKKAAADIGKFRFVGFIMRKGKLDIFLAKDSDYYVGHPGEDIVDGYYIKDVKRDSITIADRKHKINGKEVEVSLKADFEGEDADVITGASAPYVGVGATGGSVGRGSGGGVAVTGGSPTAPQRRTAPEPEGAPTVINVQTGRAVTPVETGGGTGAGTRAPAPMEGYSIP